MTSDFPGGSRPDDLGADLGPEPGLAQLIATLNSGPVGNELAGEQDAVTMFRANFRPPLSDRTAPIAVGLAEAPAPAGTRRMRRQRRLWSPGFGRLRVIGVSAAVMLGGFAAAAYAAVLPAPVQHLAHDALHFVGVPDTHHGQASGGHHLSSSQQSGSRNGRGHHSPGGHASPSAGSGSSPGSGAPTGPIALSAQAVASRITAGTAATINVQVTAGGMADPGLTLGLAERAAGASGWQIVERATTSSQGQVTFTTPDLDTNARFRVTDGQGQLSPVVVVRVVPTVVVNLTLGPHGVDDYVAVSTQFARAGDVVALQVMQDGNWVTLRTRRLNASDAVTFTISASSQQGNTLRVALLPTRFHAGAVSNSVTVPA
ncbi:MAG TPA: hypothetical protein VEL03_07795 [Streptosporangiaceae bacterium]|nr:hypothetical protein [Streptosporangiaceae bacterium]